MTEQDEINHSERQRVHGELLDKGLPESFEVATWSYALRTRYEQQVKNHLRASWDYKYTDYFSGRNTWVYEPMGQVAMFKVQLSLFRNHEKYNSNLVSEYEKVKTKLP